MISIIISSYRPSFFENLKENIYNTCGIVHEIIKIENNNRKYSISQAYNIGASKAKYNFLLFLHEDVLFHTKNWGQYLVNNLSVPNTGVIGLSGSNYYPKFPGTWWNDSKIISHIIVNDGTDKYYQHLKYNFAPRNSLEPVKCIDGVFLACKKSTFKNNPFNEKVSGFHGYDLLFSLQISKSYQNYITSDILLEHFSTGKVSSEWINNIYTVKKIFGNIESQKTNKDIELKTIYFMILVMKNNSLPKIKSLYMVLKNLSIIDLGLVNYLKAINRLRFLLH